MSEDESRLLAAGYLKSLFGMPDGSLLWHPPGTAGKKHLVETHQALARLDRRERKESAALPKANMTFGSLFSGAGLLDLGLEQAGLTVLWQCEIDNYARHVLQHHWPQVPCHRDIRKVGRRNLCQVDLIAGGFPCQDLSVAGSRAGLSGARSGLFFEMVRVVDELRPAYVLWENVPGLLSNFSPVEPPPEPVEGREWEVEEDSDFETVLRELDAIGYCGCTTGLDSQWFGVAQQRLRLFGLFARRDLGVERCGEILSLRTRCQGDPAARGRTWPDIAATIRGRSHSAGVNTPGRGGEDDSNLVTHPLRSEGADASEDGTGRGTPLVAATITSGMAKGSGVNDGKKGRPKNLILDEVATCLQERGGKGVDSDCTQSLVIASEVCPTLHTGTNQTGGHRPPGSDADTALSLVAYNIVGLGQEGKNHAYPADVTGSLQHHGNSASGNEAGTVVAFQPGVARNGRGGPQEVAHLLRASEDGGRSDCREHIMRGMSVRRLTPLECTRLQGAPDNWLDVDPSLSDSTKYRLLGNGCTVTVLRWLGRRLLEVVNEH